MHNPLTFAVWCATHTALPSRPLAAALSSDADAGVRRHASGPQLDLDHAAYVLYGVKHIDPVSPTPFQANYTL